MTKPRILCVDDEVSNVDALERLLRKKYDVLKATSGAKGLEILDQNPEGVAVIISDQRMPQMTGVEFLEMSLTRSPDSVRMLLTGYTDIESVVEAVNKGQIFRYLTKPWDPIDLVNTVDQAVEKYQLTIELKKKNQELSNALDSLKELDQAKNNFMILINHELKTPLTNILNFLELLRETKMTEEQSLYTNRVYRATLRLKEIVDDSLLIVRAELGQLKIDKGLVQLETVATESFNETSSSFPDKTMRLQLDLQVPEIVGDRRLIREIFRRLFHNAFKFGNANSPIKLESKPVASMIYIFVKNEAPAIPEKVIRKVTEPFFIDEDIMNHSSGIGLGLTICQAILRSHGSKLAVQNTDSGVRISFVIPKD